jgi:hypothetical protein
VANELDTIINSFKGFLVLSIFMSPDSVLSISSSLLSECNSLILLNINCGLSKVSFRSSKTNYGIVSQQSVGSALSIVVLSISIEVSRDFSAGSSLYSSKSIVVFLSVIDGSKEFVHQHVDFISGV